MDSKIGILFSGTWSQYTLAKSPKYKNLYKLIYQKDFNPKSIDGLEAIVVPQQYNHSELLLKQKVILDFLKLGKKVLVESSSNIDWIGGKWQKADENNWWSRKKDVVIKCDIDYTHPVYKDLSSEESCWFVGAYYSQIPTQGRVVQSTKEGKILTWETKEYGGSLLITTLNPITEHANQKIKILNPLVDNLTEWLCGVHPHGDFEISKQDYGVDLED